MLRCLQCFTSASVNGSEQVQSENYLHCHSKGSYYVLVRFKLEHQRVTSVASVRATDIAELKHPSTAANGSATAERLAIVRLYNLQENCWCSRTPPPKPKYDSCVIKHDQLPLGKVLCLLSLSHIEHLMPGKQDSVFLPYSLVLQKMLTLVWTMMMKHTLLLFQT